MIRERIYVTVCLYEDRASLSAVSRESKPESVGLKKESIHITNRNMESQTAAI